jgi:S-DNA-T family DNA segregation ATPase FtsK/SpoIIIE
MSTVRFKRATRLPAPESPGGEIHVESPPELPRATPGNLFMKLLPAVMIVASVGMMAFMFTRSKGNPESLLFGGMFLISTVGMMAGGMGRGGNKKGQMNEDRKDYLRYLGQTRRRAHEVAAAQRAERAWNFPDPATLWSLAGTRRMWERRPADADFCHLRLGVGQQRLSSRLAAPETGPVEDLEPITALAAKRFVNANSTIEDLPVVSSIRRTAAVTFNGEKGLARAIARSLIAQLVTFHSPDELVVAFVTSGSAKDEWEWAKWLPHVQHPSEVDGVGSLRMISPSLAQAEDWLDDELAERGRVCHTTESAPETPHVLVVLDGGEVTGEETSLGESAHTGVTVFDLSGQAGTLAARHGVLLDIERDRIATRNDAGASVLGHPDLLSPVEMETLARRLAPYRMATQDAPAEDEPLSSSPGLLDLLGIAGDPMTFDLNHAWRPRPKRDRYRVPFGVGAQGQPIELDIKEAAEDGMGPHGLCVGATGSGKSEFLRTLVLGMLTTHSPASLNMILVDFKGGATFLGFDEAPLVSAIITNLAGDLTLVDRIRDAIAGECARRQECLAKSNAKNVWDYERMRENGADLDPLPALFIVIDEFSEMLTAKPDFIDLFLQIGRVGRSLHMHMLLATQRLEEGKLKGLDTYLSYRIGLKTFSAAESRTAIGVTDAYELPAIPGSGYLALQGQPLIRFKSAYVSGPWRPGGVPQVTASAPVSSEKRAKRFGADAVALPALPAQPAAPEQAQEPRGQEHPPGDLNEPTQLELVVGRFANQGPPAHEVWLPPLEAPPSLDQLLPPLSATDDRGLASVGYWAAGKLVVPLGLVDKPFEQRRDTLWADFSGAAGHGAVVGGPQSGKSVLLRSLVTAMALTHTPAEVQFYALDFGGGTLTSLDRFPHVGGVASRLEPDQVRRMVAEMSQLVSERERRFRGAGIDSMADFRQRRQRGELTDDPFGDVFLLVDGWTAFRTEFESLEMKIVNLAGQGLSYGVHVVVTANRWTEIRSSLRDLLGSRFELRLGDTSESETDKRVAANVPANRPGRGVSGEKLHFLTALPRIDASSDASTVAEGVKDAAERTREVWHGRHAPAVRLLPESLPYEDLQRQAPSQPRGIGRLPVGVNEDRLDPVFLDFDTEPHLAVFTDGEGGKTNLLRAVCRGITEANPPDEAAVVLVDYRRTMLGFLESEHLVGYAVSATQLNDMVGDVRNSLQGRLPGAEVTQEQLKNRSWWHGPELFVVVDDYDLVATQSGNPLQPLSEFLPQAKDVGLHMVVARRTGGSGRALFDPILGKLKEISAPGFVGSGSKDEGVLWGGVKPSEMPPGRGVLSTRKGGAQLMQVAWVKPE